MKFKIYGKVGCPGCQQAKALLEAKGFSYEYLMLGKDYQLSDFIEAAQGNLHKSFPLILHAKDVDGVWAYLGGLEALKQHIK